MVLLVDDSAADRRLTTDVLENTGLSIQLRCVASGEEALEALRGENGNEDALRPDLVLLDLGLPGISGQEVLAAIKADEALQNVPVVVLSSQDDDRTVGEMFGLGAHEFASKPLDREQIMSVIEYVTEFA